MSNIKSHNNGLPFGKNGELVTLGGGNINQRIRNACDTYPDTTLWEDATIASGDIIVARGNTGGAGWIEISKDPAGTNNETALTVKETLDTPVRLTTMVSLTHRNAGEQIASVEYFSDTDGTVSTPDPVLIDTASQTTTTITVNFATAPAQPFRVGEIVNLYGFVDTRLNINNGTVATVPSTTQITVVGNDYTFTSTTITSTSGNGTAYVERPDQLGGAYNGFAAVHGSATVTQRRFYTRANGGTVRPSGTLAGSHQVTTITDLSTAGATAPYNESFASPNEQVLMLSRDGVVYSDRAPDAGNTLTARYRSTQLIPNPEAGYQIRFRAIAAHDITRPIANIVSVSKAGSTTATITTDVPHGLTTGEYVGFYGVRDQTNFPNQAAGVVCTVTDATTLTVVQNPSATATSYGGFLMKVEGQQALGGAIAQVVQSVVRTSNVLTITGNTTWAAPAAIGNLVNLYGVRVDGTGADLGVDGVYVVRNIATSTLTLEPLAGYGPTGDDITSTNCGGGVVQRFGVRIHAILAVDYNPLMTEPVYKGNVDPSEQVPVTVITMPTTTAVAGSTAQDAAVPSPIAIGGRASNANLAAMSATGDLVNTMHTMIGALVSKPYAIPEAGWNASLALTTTTAQALAAAAGAGIKRHITAVQATNTGTAVDLIILDGATERWRLTLPQDTPVCFTFPTELATTANTALNANLSAAGTVRINAQGYTAP